MAATKINKAFYFGWRGHIDTQLTFSQFFGQNHTITGWFMPQYAHAFVGPIFAEVGSTSKTGYVFGFADYREGTGGYKTAGPPVLQLKIGSQRVLYLVPDFKANVWHHLAIVRVDNQFRVYIDGQRRTPVSVITPNIVGIGIAKSNDRVYTWYDNGLAMIGSSTDLDAHSLPFPYKCPPGKTPKNIVGMDIAPQGDRVFVWYDDGMASSGTSGVLDKFRKPYKYSLPPGKTPKDIVAMGIAGSDSRVYTWYKDGTATVGSSDDLDKHKGPYAYKLPDSRTPAHVREMAITAKDRVYAWYTDNTVSSGTSSNLSKHTQPADFGPVYKAGSTIAEIEVNPGAGGQPMGKLRFGRVGQKRLPTAAENNWQAYGILDDVAVFDRALTPTAIKFIYTNRPRLLGDEQGVIAAWTFDLPQPNQPPLPPQFQAAYKAGPRTYHVFVSADRNSATDATNFDNPLIIGETEAEIQLPFKPDEIWRVGQGYDVANGSHNGSAAFCWDFSLASGKGNTAYPNGTEFAPVFSVAAGRVANYQRDGAPGGGGRESNFVRIKIGAGEYNLYLHLAAKTLNPVIKGGQPNPNNPAEFVYPDNQGPLLPKGTQLAKLGPVAEHLHMDLSNRIGGVTIPMAFANYEASNDKGKTWKKIIRGIPKAGQWIRRA